MRPINRSKCVVCEHEHLEPLYNFAKFPVFMGCTAEPSATDVRMDMSWAICPECGTIQLDKLVPLDILYPENHNEAVGGIWREHHSQFADFILEHGGDNRLEIGGAGGIVARLARNISQTGRWLILEPNLFTEVPDIPNTEFQQGWFDDDYQPPFEIDTVIHSHVMEHLYEPRRTLAQIQKIVPINGKMIFSIPNMEVWLKNKYTNCLMFEHTYYLPEDVAEFLVASYGFKVTAKQYFKEHSIFFACEKLAPEKCPTPAIPRKYQVNRSLYEDFVNYYVQIVADIEHKVPDYLGQKYIFGAHIFTLFLLGFGLKEKYFLNVLDNAPGKIGNRLYGTDLMVKSPKCLNEHQEALLVLKAGAYTDEIKKDIVENINRNILFC